MRQLYLAATGMNRGKTTFALGLLAALVDRGLNIGFIKPVGQRYAIVDGVPADEDAILVRSVFGMPDALDAMSPVHIPRGFTKAFISGEVVEDLLTRIRARTRASPRAATWCSSRAPATPASARSSACRNAEVAAMLGAPAVIVSEAGVGRPIDEIVLNHALFARHGVEVVGAVVNKVDADAHPSLPDILRQRPGAPRHRAARHAAVPAAALQPHAVDARRADAGRGAQPGRRPGPRHRARGHRRHAAAPPAGAHRPGSLLIVPGDREDVIHATIAANQTQRALAARARRCSTDCAIARASDARPSDPSASSWRAWSSPAAIGRARADLEAIRQAGLFGYLVDEDTYGAASEVHDLLVKTHPADTRQDRRDPAPGRRAISTSTRLLERFESRAAAAGQVSPRRSADPAPAASAPGDRFHRRRSAGFLRGMRRLLGERQQSRPERHAAGSARSEIRAREPPRQSRRMAGQTCPQHHGTLRNQEAQP